MLMLEDEENVWLGDNPHLEGTREEYLTKNHKLAHTVANRYKWSLSIHPSLEYNDLYTWAFIGMMKAYAKYDPTKFENVTRFSTYAFHMMQGEIQRYLRDYHEGAKFPRSAGEIWNKIRKLDLYDRTPKEVAEILDVSARAVSIAFAYGQSNVKSLDDVVFENDGDPVTLGDQLGEEVDYSSHMEIEDFLSKLPEREQYIIRAHAMDIRQQDIADHLGITQVQVSRMIKRIQEIAVMYRDGKDITKIKWGVRKWPLPKPKEGNDVKQAKGNTELAKQMLLEGSHRNIDIANATGCDYAWVANTKSSMKKEGLLPHVDKMQMPEVVRTPAVARNPDIRVSEMVGNSVATESNPRLEKQNAVVGYTHDTPTHRLPTDHLLTEPTGRPPEVPITSALTITLQTTKEGIDVDTLKAELNRVLDFVKASGVSTVQYSFTIS